MTNHRLLRAMAGLAALVLFVTPARAQLPEGGNGIAANYPGDVGIANDSEVLFVEDFEEGSIPAITARWEDVRNGNIMSLSTDIPPGSSGLSSLLIHKQPGDGSGGGHLYRRILPGTGDNGYTQLFARFYVKFAPSCDPLHHFGTNLGGNNPATAWPMVSAGNRVDGDVSFWSGIEPFGDTWRWDFYTYWMEMRSWENDDGTGSSFYGNTFIREGADQSWQAAGPEVVRDEWICIEMMIQVNDPVSGRGGEQAFWVNGQLWRMDSQIVSHLGEGFPNGTWLRDKWSPDPAGGPFEGFRWRSSTDLLVNYVWIYTYTQQDDYDIPVLFDDVVVATSYIGPIQATDCEDADGDGYTSSACGGPDCADDDDTIHPAATEICDDGADNNCNGLIDAADPACSGPVCQDSDGDGYGDPADSCTHTERDCDDADESVHPGATEVCDNGVDDNCDGTIDEGVCGPPPGVGNDGCGCTTTSTGSTGLPILLLLLLTGWGWLGRRKRR